MRKTTQTYDFIELSDIVEKTLQWFRDRGLDKAKASDQYLKLVEEAGELVTAQTREELRDALGDVMVVVTGICLIKGINALQVFEGALNSLTGSISDFDRQRMHAHLIRTLSYIARDIARGKVEELQLLLKGLVEITARLFDSYLVAKSDLIALPNTAIKCFSESYEIIKDRKGKLVDGVWIKESDLIEKEN